MFKKGSLELSVNAIVIIIIAITMLSVGVYFIKTVFGGAAIKLADALNTIDEQTKSSFLDSCNEEVCVQGSASLEKGGKKTILMAINNRYDCSIDQPISGTDNGAKISLSNCQLVDTANCNGLTINTLKLQIVDAGTKQPVPIVVSTNSKVVPGLYRYGVTVAGKCSSSPDVRIDRTVYFDVQITS